MDILKELPFITVVIASRNEFNFIEKCLNSFLNQDYPKDKYEIFIYDANSTDGTKEYLLEQSKKQSNISIFSNPKLVQAYAWNLGFSISKADFVVMMGAHSFVDSDFFKKNVKLLENYPYIACVGGLVKAIGGDNKSNAIALAFNNPFGVGNAKYRYSDTECLVETINYGMYRKSMIDQVGPIDEKILRGQDWEFNYRIVKKFGKMIFSPSIKVYYYARSNFRKLWKKQFDAGFWKIYIIKKHPKSLLFRHIIPLVFILTLFALFFISILTANYLALIILIILYILINIVYSFIIASSESYKLFFYLVFSFFIMHFAYGIGSIKGIYKFVFNAPPVK
ncbi:MAG: glycosyltransferase family 2 protein [Calditrichaceae bacterium]|nr:glycosyltransferase family 2 protein [Calditrichaceae bacterium]MBN2708047.1 glycosyltransferase family 2 protein [Calditrichaceae bacterium]RQV97765.1 MAG: glycosyltransferase family 2 protein [Calditrichota bacterium]